MAEKWQNTKKAKAQTDAMSRDIAKKLGFDAPKVRTSPTRNVNYFGNILNEVKDVISAKKRTDEASGLVGPGTDTRANNLRKKQTKQEGQLWGALLQGRRYDNKTGKQIKK